MPQSQRKKPQRLVVTAILDALKALKKKDVPLTRHIVRQLETMPIAWSPFMDDAHILGHVEEQGYMMLNPKAFSKSFTRKQRASLMLHELMHSIGGYELDAEAIEYWIYPSIASHPSTDDEVLFRTNQGLYVRRDPVSGNVHLKRTGEVIANFRPKSEKDIVE